MPIIDDELLTSAEVGRRMNLSPDRIRQLARAGRLRPILVAGRIGQRFFTVAEIERYLQEVQQRQTLEPRGVDA